MKELRGAYRTDTLSRNGEQISYPASEAEVAALLEAPGPALGETATVVLTPALGVNALPPLPDAIRAVWWQAWLTDQDLLASESTKGVVRVRARRLGIAGGLCTHVGVQRRSARSPVWNGRWPWRGLRPRVSVTPPHPPTPAASPSRRSRHAPTVRRPAARADHRRPRGARARLRDGARPGGRRPRRADRRVRRAGGAQHEGPARGVRGRRPAGAGDPRRGGHQHHRHRRRGQPRGLRLQRARAQRGRGRRADPGAAAGDRPPDRRQRGRPARRPLGQERRTARPRGCSGRRWASSASARSASRSPSARPRSASACRSLAKPGRSAAAVARAEELGITMCDSLEELVSTSDIVQPPRPVQRGHQAPRRRGVPRPDEDGRDPAQHLARRRGRRGRPAARRWTPATCGRAWTCSPTSPARGKGSWDSPLARHPERRRAPTTSARRPCRRSARSRRA